MTERSPGVYRHPGFLGDSEVTALSLAVDRLLEHAVEHVAEYQIN